MSEKINIAEILKDCPSGMELDCTIYDDVTLYKIDDSPEHEYPIRIETKNGYFLDLTKYGTYTDIEEAKCVIFPKGKTTWEGFNRPFVDGDIVVAEDAESFQLFLLKHLTLIEDDNSYDGYCYFGWDFQRNELFEKGNWGFNRLATEEEKEKLFNAIKEHGYKWNEETKTLEKLIKPWTIQDAKNGDVLAFNDETIVIFKDLYNKTSFHSYCHIEEGIFTISKEDMPDWWEGKGFYPATEEQRDFLFQKIKEAGYKWNSETKTLEKLVESHASKKFYIRIGDIPSEEKSVVYKGDVVIGYEDGVSVYDCIEIDGLYHIVMPFPLKEGQGMTYECLIQEITQCRYKIENPRNVYLVSGIEVGKGHDNEPLIKEVKILKDLTEQFNTKTDNTEETKTLEKLLKFKVGDKIQCMDYKVKITEVNIEDECYEYESIFAKGIGSIEFSEQDNWELIPNKFDINDLKPFESKVLVRNSDVDSWCPAIFGCKRSTHTLYKYATMTENYYAQCIPYKGNEFLRGTTDDCNEYFKNW